MTSELTLKSAKVYAFFLFSTHFRGTCQCRIENNHDTLLTMASKQQSVKTVEYLLKQGAMVDKPSIIIPPDSNLNDFSGKEILK